MMTERIILFAIFMLIWFAASILLGIGLGNIIKWCGTKPVPKRRRSF